MIISVSVIMCFCWLCVTDIQSVFGDCVPAELSVSLSVFFYTASKAYCSTLFSFILQVNITFSLQCSSILPVNFTFPLSVFLYIAIKAHSSKLKWKFSFLLPVNITFSLQFFPLFIRCICIDSFTSSTHLTFLSCTPGY